MRSSSSQLPASRSLASCLNEQCCSQHGVGVPDCVLPPTARAVVRLRRRRLAAISRRCRDADVELHGAVGEDQAVAAGITRVPVRRRPWHAVTDAWQEASLPGTSIIRLGATPLLETDERFEFAPRASAPAVALETSAGGRARSGDCQSTFSADARCNAPARRKSGSKAEHAAEPVPILPAAGPHRQSETRPAGTAGARLRSRLHWPPSVRERPSLCLYFRFIG